MQISMFKDPDHMSRTLAPFGWSPFFAEQVMEEELALSPMRIATVHRSRMTAISPLGPLKLSLGADASTAAHAVGDWVLVDAETHLLVRRLARMTLLQRRTEGGRLPQLIAANVDTLFIVTSCNEDLNPARLERYLALANEAGTRPVIILTKADLVEDATPYLARVAELQRGVEVVALDAKAPAAAHALSRWCGDGQTVALVGSSGVGKSSLLNTLADKSAADAQATGSIRAGDAKGRHTTTSRSLHPSVAGGWVIDTPGMRTLHVSDTAAGLAELFAEITELAPLCRFRDCTHAHEPGCAVQKAMNAGTLDPARLDRWRKLTTENRDNTPVLTGPRGNKKTKAPGNRR